MYRTEYKKLRNKALSELQKLFDKNSTKLFYIAKVVDINSTQYKRSTPLDVIYENMDRHINGDGGETNKERAAKSFMETANMDMETLKIKSIVRDSVFFKYIISKADGYIYHTKTGAMLGRNVSDVIEHLKNPLNEDVLKDLNIACEKYWNS
jgi:Tfp pilus assembly protein PilP